MMNESMVRRNFCSNTQACTPRHAVFIMIEGHSDLFPLMLDFLRFGKIYISITISKRAVLCEAAAFKLGVTPDDVAQDLPPRVNAFKTDQA
jgi:hypothetical protein